MNHEEEVKKFTLVKSLGGFSILMIGFIQFIWFDMVTSIGAIAIDIILIASVCSITIKKYHEYHITDTDFYQAP